MGRPSCLFKPALLLDGTFDGLSWIAKYSYSKYDEESNK